MPAGLFKYFNTIRFLKPEQIFGRIWFKAYRPKPVFDPPCKTRIFLGKWVNPLTNKQYFSPPERFNFLNDEHEISKSSDWNNLKWGKLWLYNLHYFDVLCAEDAEKHNSRLIELLNRWIVENPPVFGIGWEPYPISLRIVNWIKWHLSGNVLDETCRNSLTVQVRHLVKRLEYHLLGNHLLANAKALIFAGLFFRGSEAEKWLSKGLRIIAKELPEQILTDGGHFERSPMYHAIVLEDLLDIINITQVYEPVVSDYARRQAEWRKTAEKMIDWLRVMTHPDGEIVLFNDASFNISAQLSAIERYAGRLRIKTTGLPKEGITVFKDTGYARLENNDAAVFLDLAPIGPDYLPGHAHADTLTFEFSLSGRRCIVDSGVSTYEAGAERLRQRRTSAHNTVEIDGQDSSEVWNSFRVARRATPFGLRISEADRTIKVVCQHDGYKRLAGKPIHQREWCLDEKQLIVKDTISGEFNSAQGRFYFHPDVNIEFKDSIEAGVIRLERERKLHWQLKGGTARIKASTYHPEFGLSIANQCLEVEFENKKAEIVFSWD